MGEAQAIAMLEPPPRDSTIARGETRRLDTRAPEHHAPRSMRGLGVTTDASGLVASGPGSFDENAS